MADIESLSSDSDDEEYVPEGGVPSSGASDESEGEPEDNPVGLGKRRSLRQAQNTATDQRTTRKRQKRSLYSEDDTSGPICETGQTGQGSKASQEEEKKSRIDDLWASFKMETAQPKKNQQPPPSASGSEVAAVTTKTQSTQGKAVGSSSIHREGTTSSEKLIKVKQKYDFAGEEVVVEKEVAKDSKEAQEYLKTQQQQPERRQPISLTSSAPQKSGTPVEALSKQMSTGSKRHSGISAVLQSIGKKPKMSTLEKSNLDWQKFKKKEGLEDELTQHNKDGYLAKREFLQKADLKQFELEREERLKRFRRMY